MLLDYVKKFDPRFVPLFTHSVRRNMSELERLLHTDAIKGNIYHCFAENAYLIRKNDLHARAIASGARPVSDFPLFSNALLTDEPEDRSAWSLPVERLHFGNHQVYTFEFDRPGTAFFSEQLSWCLPMKDWQRSPLGHLFKSLKEFADFRALTAAWSGNKSLHLHLTFATKLYRATHGEPENLQRGHHAHWQALLPMVMDALKPSEGPGPDTNLSWPTAYRRTPNSMRVLEKPNPLGQPAGTTVPQLVLWEQAVERNPATKLFHSPQRFVPAARLVSAIRATRQGRLSAEEMSHCEMRLREHYLDSPLEFVRLDCAGPQYRALFRNGSLDSNPSSYLGEDFVVPRLLGRDADLLTQAEIFPLDAPLGIKLAEWCLEIARSEGLTGDQKADARNLIRNNLTRYIVLAQDEPLLLRAAEGISKTTTIINDHERINSAISHLGGPAMYAFADYENAEEKCSYFNDKWADKGMVAIVWRSWSRWYSETAEMMGCEILTDAEANAAGISLWKLISRSQPDVLDEVRREHRAVWDKIGNRKPVIFTVHDVAHRWAQNGRTRQMFDRHFFDEAQPVDARARSVLSLLVHDELSPQNLVHILSQAQKLWLDDLFNRSGDIWTDYKLAEQRKAYDRHLTARGDCGLGFHQVRELSGLAMEEVSLAATEEYPAFANYNIYACAEEKWHVVPRMWWREGDNPVAERIVFLTTETVPMAVAQKAIPNLMATVPSRLLLGRDPIIVTAKREVRSEHADRVTSAYHAKAGWLIVGNKLSHDIPNAMTHARARGRNDLSETSIIQTATMFDPGHYRQLQALNSWTGRDDLVLLSHVDQINQTAGRNCGFRNNGETEHRLLINQTLYRSLLTRPDIMQELRYQFVVELDAGQKRKAQQK